MRVLHGFLKIGKGVQAILKFCLSDLKGCIVVTDGKE
jgi:hypothetical protein